jgi:hypothetical protein
MRNAERLAALDAKLPAVLSGTALPDDTAEALELADIAVCFRQRYAGAARLYAAAFDANPRLADDPARGHRYNAACAAALAAAARGDAAAAPEKLRTSHWRQALDWLRADLAAWQKRAATDRRAVAKTLAHWQTDPDLAGVRDPQELAKLPPVERAAWEQFWTDVADLLRRVGG